MVAVKESEQVQVSTPEVQKNIPVWSYKYESYKLQVIKKDDGYWGLITRGKDVEWSGAIKKEEELARGSVVCQLHKMRPDILVPGTMAIEPELLAFHPRNKQIYSDSKESNDALLNQIQASGKIYRLTVSSTTDAVPGGLTVSGNRRLNAAITLNANATSEGKPKPFPMVDVEVKAYEDDLDILDDLVRENLYRDKKTNVELYREYSIILEVEKRKAEKRMKQGKATKGKKTSSRSAAANRMAATSGVVKDGRTWSSGATHTHWMDSLKEEGEKELAGIVEGLINEGHVTAVRDIRDMYARTPDLAKEVAMEKAKPENRHKQVTINNLAKKIQAQKIAEGSTKAETKEELIEQALIALEAIGAKPTDDYMTPLDIKMTMVEFLGTTDDDGIKRVDLDPFANLEKDSIPSRKAYNVIDNGLTQELEGTIATNIPFSIAGDCIKAIDVAIRKGTTKEGAFVAQSGILHNKATQGILSFHKMSVCLCRGRVSFEHGSILSHVKPEKEEGSTTTFNTDTAIYYYGDRHDQFFDDFKHKGTVIRVGLQPSDTNSFSMPKWVDNEERGILETNWMNTAIEIIEDDEGLLVPWIDGKNTEEKFEELKQAQSYAIGYILMSKNQSNTLDEVDSSVFS